jgi:hypothetical protein
MIAAVRRSVAVPGQHRVGGGEQIGGDGPLEDEAVCAGIGSRQSDRLMARKLAPGDFRPLQRQMAFANNPAREAEYMQAVADVAAAEAHLQEANR